MYRTYEHGEWSSIHLRDEDIEALDKADKYTRMLSCGHWRLALTQIWGEFTQGTRIERWGYEVCMEIPGSDAKGGPVLFETVLVRDLPSLLSLFKLLRDADVVTMEEIE